MEKFRGVLERTTLQSLIKLSSEVTGRLEFLDFLHALVYGDAADSVKERKQLHKILEPNCWIFGPAYHLATSDKNFRAVIRRHRDEAGLPPVPDEELKNLAGTSDIPDCSWRPSGSTRRFRRTDMSSEIKGEIDLQRRQKNKAHGMVGEYENATVWVLSWGEIIDRARSEMRLVRDHLEQKSRELSVSEYLQKHFPEVLERAPSRLAATVKA